MELQGEEGAREIREGLLRLRLVFDELAGGRVVKRVLGRPVGVLFAERLEAWLSLPWLDCDTDADPLEAQETSPWWATPLPIRRLLSGAFSSATGSQGSRASLAGPKASCLEWNVTGDSRGSMSAWDPPMVGREMAFLSTGEGVSVNTESEVVLLARRNSLCPGSGPGAAFSGFPGKSS